jgi:flagellar biosynthesis protein FlhA
MTDIPASTMMRDGMARPTGRDMLGWIARGEVAMAIGVIGVILLLILPIPVFLMDVLLAVSLVSSVLILMTAVMMNEVCRDEPSTPPSNPRPREGEG